MTEEQSWFFNTGFEQITIAKLVANDDIAFERKYTASDAFQQRPRADQLQPPRRFIPVEFQHFRLGNDS